MERRQDARFRQFIQVQIDKYEHDPRSCLFCKEITAMLEAWELESTRPIEPSVNTSEPAIIGPVLDVELTTSPPPEPSTVLTISAEAAKEPDLSRIMGILYATGATDTGKPKTGKGTETLN